MFLLVCGGLVVLEGAAAAIVTIGSSAVAALLGLAVLLGFFASALAGKLCKAVLMVLKRFALS